MEYQVKAVRNKHLVMLRVDAAHIQEALAQAKLQGFTPISATAGKLSKLSSKQHFPLTLFSQELLALLNAGLNLVDAIETLTSKETKFITKSSLDSILKALYQGSKFSDALEKQAEVFPLLYVATVRASEKTGDLAQALGRYVAYQEKLDLLKKKVVSASIYPLLLMLVGGAVILFLLGFVVPKFSSIYADTGTDLPALSMLLLNWGDFIQSHGKIAFLSIAVVIALIIIAFSREDFRKLIFRQLWRFPALGERLKVYQLARFYRTLGMLLKGGTPMAVAMQSVRGLLDSSLQQSMKQAEISISQGQAISAAMISARMTTPISERMLVVGERSGNIGEMMERIADFYDDDISRWIDWFTRLFEPLLMLFIGLVIGVVVLLLYMPIFELAGSIQ